MLVDPDIDVWDGCSLSCRIISKRLLTTNSLLDSSLSLNPFLSFAIMSDILTIKFLAIYLDFEILESRIYSNEEEG